MKIAFFIVGLGIALSASAGDHFLAAKCSVAKCDSFGAGGAGQLLCDASNVLDLYVERGNPNGFYAFNNAAQTSLIGNFVLSKARIVETEKGYTVTPAERSISAFEITKGVYEKSRMTVNGLTDGSAGAHFTLQCSTQ